MTAERSAKQRLDELRASLFGFQSELAEAEAEDLNFVAERAREEIRKLQRLIRQHCAAHGLPLPKGVPEESGARE